MPTTEPSLWQALASAISGKETNLEDFNDEQIVAQANLHGVSQLLNKQVYEGTVSGLSETANNQLKSLSYANAALNLVLNSATEKLLHLLAEHEIPALLLKGTPIAHLYYPGTHLRPRCDSDIYINESDLDKTAGLLTRNKYQLSGLGKRKYSSKQFVAALTSFKNDLVHFDIHWKLSNRVMFRSTLPFEDCLETSQPVPKLGPNAHSLCITDLMLHACIHRIAHGRNTERNRLIWLYDIHLLAGAMNEAEMDHFLLAARQKAVGYLCADALEVCQTIFNTALPKNSLNLLRENHRHEPSAKLLHSSKLQWAMADMQSLKGIRQKAAFAKELLFG